MAFKWGIICSKIFFEKVVKLKETSFLLSKCLVSIGQHCTFVSLTVTHSFSFSFIIFDHQRFAFLWHGFFSFVCLELTASSISRRWTWSFQALIIKHSFVKEWKSTHGMSIGSIIVSETHFMCFVCFIIINVIVPCMSPTFKTRQESN